MMQQMGNDEKCMELQKRKNKIQWKQDAKICKKLRKNGLLEVQRMALKLLYFQTSEIRVNQAPQESYFVPSLG